MGQYQTNVGSVTGAITHFDPDNTEDILHILTEPCSNMSIPEMLEKAKEHFGEGFDIKDFNIRAEKIHTRCIYYDLHSPEDWDNFIIIERIK